MDGTLGREPNWQLNGAPVDFGYTTEANQKSGAPTKPMLLEIVQKRRTELLTELRELELCMEALESNPSFDAVFNKVTKILMRGRL